MDIFKKFRTLTVIDAINLSRTDKNAVLVDVRPKDCLLYTSSRQS